MCDKIYLCTKYLHHILPSYPPKFYVEIFLYFLHATIEKSLIIQLILIQSETQNQTGIISILHSHKLEGQPFSKDTGFQGNLPKNG